MKKKITIVLAVFALSACGLFVAGCNEAAAPKSTDDGLAAAAADAAVEGDISMAYFKQHYPLQFASAQGVTVRDGMNHGHWALNARMTGPFVRGEGPQVRNLERTEDGYYMISEFNYDVDSEQWVIENGDLSLADESTQIKKGCFACKSSLFNAVWEEEGDESLNADVDQPFLDMMAGEVWGCTTCHGSVDDMESADSQSELFRILAGDSYDMLDPGERVCAQCHNEMGGYRTKVSLDSSGKADGPWRYGLDADSIYQAVLEDGAATVDEPTGIMMASSSHADIEVFLGSQHESLGLTCTSCHMATITDKESGEAYSNHHASQSPLESEETLEYCLTCHKSQGIESTTEMKEMVRSLQAETADTIETALSKMDILYDLILNAVQSGNVDEATLDLARDSYSKAKYYVSHAEATGSVPLGPIHDGRKVVHDPVEVTDLISRSNKLLDEAIQSLS